MEDSIPPELAAALSALNGLVTNLKKSTHSGNSVYSYYTEECAVEVKTVIEKLVSSGRPILLPLGDYSLSSVYNRWNQGKRYLKEHMDPDGKYAAILENIRATRAKSKGVILHLVAAQGAFAAALELQQEDWRPGFRRFIDESEHGDVFERQGIALTAEDIEFCNQALQGVEHMFVYEINQRGIRIMRYDTRATNRTDD